MSKWADPRGITAVVAAMTGGVGVLMLVLFAGLSAWHNDGELSPEFSAILSSTFGVLIGAVAGYIAGRPTDAPGPGGGSPADAAGPAGATVRSASADHSAPAGSPHGRPVLSDTDTEPIPIPAPILLDRLADAEGTDAA